MAREGLQNLRLEEGEHQHREATFSPQEIEAKRGQKTTSVMQDNVARYIHCLLQYVNSCAIHLSIKQLTS